MIGFVTSTVFVVVGTIVFLGAVIFLFMNINSNRCSRCHGKMKDEENITIFEGATSKDGNINFPPLVLKKYTCSSCGSNYLELYTPNMGKSYMRIYGGENIKQYVQVSDSEIIKRFEDNIKNNFEPLIEDDFTSCLNPATANYDLGESKLGISISENAFAQIYQKAKKYVEDTNKLTNQLSNKIV